MSGFRPIDRRIARSKSHQTSTPTPTDHHRRNYHGRPAGHADPERCRAIRRSSDQQPKRRSQRTARPGDLPFHAGRDRLSLYEVRRQLAGNPVSRGALARLKIPPVDTFSELGVGTLSIPILSMFGLLTGITAGMLGISGALLLIPGLVYLLDIRSRKAILASLIVVWITSFLATISHAWHEHVDLGLTLALMFGGTIGARIGSELSSRLEGQSLRSGIGWLSLFAASLVLFQFYQLLK